MKFKLWRRRLSISAPRMTIKTHQPWPVRLAVMLLVIGLAGMLAVWAYDLGRRFAGAGTGKPMIIDNHASATLRAQQEKVTETAHAIESQLNIERSAQRQLVNQVKVLEAENAKLKEDLAFFESLLPPSSRQGISIRQFAIEMASPNQLRYRLLVMQGGKGRTDFMGQVQLVVSVSQAGKNMLLDFPSKMPSNEVDKFTLNFKHYQRLEGVIGLPENVSVKSVQARVLEKGQVRVQQAANL